MGECPLGYKKSDGHQFNYNKDGKSYHSLQ